MLGVGLMNLESGQSLVFNGDRRFPMQSVFKLPLGAAVLAEVDAGRLRADRAARPARGRQLSPPHCADRRRLARPARLHGPASCSAPRSSDSDNTAADVLMKRIGGPGRGHRLADGQARARTSASTATSANCSPDVYGMASFRPAWRDAAAFAAARDAVPPAGADGRHARYMADPRDTATPRGMLEFLQHAGPRRPALAGLDAPAAGADERRRRAARAGCGPACRRTPSWPTGPATSGIDLGLSTAHNDVGVFTLPDKRALRAGVFLSGSTAG